MYWFCRMYFLVFTAEHHFFFKMRLFGSETKAESSVVKIYVFASLFFFSRANLLYIHLAWHQGFGWFSWVSSFHESLKVKVGMHHDLWHVHSYQWRLLHVSSSDYGHQWRAGSCGTWFMEFAPSAGHRHFALSASSPSGVGAQNRLDVSNVPRMCCPLVCATYVCLWVFFNKLGGDWSPPSIVELQCYANTWNADDSELLCYTS